jgi:hypothetical protein
MTRRPAPRRGATTVEFALVCTVFFLFLFGVFEYCRYLVVLQTATNTARDAARFASVNVNNLGVGPAASLDFRGTPGTDPTPGGYPGSRPVFDVPAIRTYVVGPFDDPTLGGSPGLQLPRGRMGGVQNMLKPISGGAQLVQVYPCDPTTLYADPPTFQPRVQPQTVNGVTEPAVWNRAQFTERIAVRIIGTYTPILPTFLKMNTITRVNVIAVMGSEG